MRNNGLVGVGLALAAFAILAGVAGAQSTGGMPGYIWKANNFAGTYAQWCLQSGYGQSCVTSLGSSANDTLAMKWNQQWINCNNNGYNNATYCAGAWVDNEINGKVPGGDGAVWHYKIIWVGSTANQSSYWAPGGYSVWGNYEVIMDQGTNSTGHFFNTLAKPNGYK